MTTENQIASKIFSIFPALTHSSFRWFWGGQVISLIGTWTQNIGQAWLVLQLTNSPFLLGLVTAMQFAPVLLFSLHAGAWIDRLPKRKILVITQATLMTLAFALSFLVGTGMIQFWMLIVMAFILGVANTVDIPARQSFIIELVGREHLTNAIALNSAIFNGARLIGPAIAGLIMGVWGPMWCFLINGFSFIGVLSILIFIPSIPRGEKPVVRQGAVWPEIKEGLSYIRRTPQIFLTILMLGFLSTIAMNFNVLVPVLAKLELHQEALGFGLLMSALGFGALLGALTVAVRSNEGPQTRLLTMGALGLGIFSVLIGLQNHYIFVAITLALMGWSMIIFAASANSLVQLTVESRFRGRVMSVYSLVFGGMTPLGSVYSGALSNLWGAKTTFILSGILSLVFVIGILYLRKQYLGGEKRVDRSTL
jgi:MFS family permease